jgi:acetolactate synthase I/II/III large subunit
VVNTFMGKGSISSADPLSLGTFGLQTRDLINCAFDKSDLVVTVGYDFVEYNPIYWNSEPHRHRIIHIDSLPAETDRNYPVAIELTGDLAPTLKVLTKEATSAVKARTYRATKGGQLSYTTILKKKIDDELKKYSDDDAFPLKPQRVISEIRKALGEKDILVCDVGMHKTWISRIYPAYEPSTVIISNGFASMGISIPGAIAAKLAKPDSKVLAVCGDGGFMMMAYDLLTAKDLNLALTILVFDDGMYGQIDWKQRAKFGGKSYFANFSNPDFVKLAEGFGCRGKRVESAKELEKALQNALRSEDVWLLDVPIDTEENQLLAKRLGVNVRCT